MRELARRLDEKGDTKRSKDGRGEKREMCVCVREREESRLIYLIASPGLQPGFNASPTGRLA